MTALDDVIRKLSRSPARWDGHKVDWEEWQHAPDVRRISESGDQSTRTPGCEKCGCTEQLLRRGTTTETSNHADGITVLYAQRVTLILMRCVGCASTTVWDGETFWELDETDYEPRGSYERKEKQ